MRLGRLVDANFRIGVQKLAQQDIPLSAAFKLKGLIKKVEEELTKYEEVRKMAVEKFGSRDSNGDLILDEQGNISLTEENIQNLTLELRSLLDTEVDVGSIKMDELGSKIVLSAKDLFALSDFVTE